MLTHQRHHQQRHGTGRGRDHPGAAAGKGNHNRDTERGVQPDLGVYAGNDGEGNRFRDQGQRHDQARQQITAHVGEPLAADGFNQIHRVCCLYRNKENKA